MNGFDPSGHRKKRFFEMTLVPPRSDGKPAKVSQLLLTHGRHFATATAHVSVKVQVNAQVPGCKHDLLQLLRFEQSLHKFSEGTSGLTCVHKI